MENHGVSPVEIPGQFIELQRLVIGKMGKIWPKIHKDIAQKWISNPDMFELQFGDFLRHFEDIGRDWRDDGERITIQHYKRKKDMASWLDYFKKKRDDIFFDKEAYKFLLSQKFIFNDEFFFNYTSVYRADKPHIGEQIDTEKFFLLLDSLMPGDIERMGLSKISVYSRGVPSIEGEGLNMLAIRSDSLDGKNCLRVYIYNAREESDQEERRTGYTTL